MQVPRLPVRAEQRGQRLARLGDPPLERARVRGAAAPLEALGLLGRLRGLDAAEAAGGWLEGTVGRLGEGAGWMWGCWGGSVGWGG